MTDVVFICFCFDLPAKIQLFYQRLQLFTFHNSLFHIFFVILQPN